MARKIILLERLSDAGDPLTFRYVYWADVPAARQALAAKPAFVSAVLDATAAEKTALQSGAVAEVVRTSAWPAGATIATIQADLIAGFTAYQAQVSAYNPWLRYGTSWDGTTWTSKTTA